MINPIHKLEWKIRFMSSPNLFYALRTNANQLLLKSIRYIIATNGFLTAYVVGHPNSGKSEVADSLAYAYKKRLGTDQLCEIEYTFNFGDTLDQILKHEELQTPSVLFLQDEVPVMHGKGSRIAKNALSNILTVTRAKGWGYVFSSPTLTELPGIQLILETMIMNFKKRTTMCMLYTPTLKPIGVVEIPLIKDNAIREMKLERKMLNIAQILESGGYQSLDLSTYDKLRKSQSGIDSPVIIPYDKELTTDLRKMTIEHLEAYGVNERDRKIFTEFCNGIKQRIIGHEYELEQPTISKIIQTISQKHLGYSFEDIYYQIKLKEHPDWKNSGKNTPDPDLINFRLRECLSVKCYSDYRNIVTLPWKEIAKSELEQLKNGFSLKLIFYNIYWDELFIQEITEEVERFSFKRSKRR